MTALRRHGLRRSDGRYQFEEYFASESPQQVLI